MCGDRSSIALAGAARVAWPVFQSLNRRVPSKTFHPAWAPAPLLKSSERSKPHTRLAAQHRFAVPGVRRDTRARSSRVSSRSSRSSTRRTARFRAHILERDGQIVIEKTCPAHGTFTDTLAIDPAFLERIEKPVSGPRLSRGRQARPARSRHVVDPARARRGAHDRPDQSLQHDVRPVLHGRQPGRLRPRAHAGRREGAARRRDQRSSRGGR